MLFIRRTDTLCWELQRNRESKIELATQTLSVIPICSNTLWDRANTHRKIFQNQSITSRGSPWWLSTTTKSQQHNAAEISYACSWAGPVNSHRGRRRSWARCFPKDKRYINKQQRRERNTPFLPVILLCLHNTVCECVCVGNKSQVNALWLYTRYLGRKFPDYW